VAAMETRRFLSIAVPSIVLAAASFVLAGVLDSNALFVMGLAFVVIVLAARSAFLSDVVMAGLIVAPSASSVSLPW
jgi:hypothetical protein